MAELSKNISDLNKLGSAPGGRTTTSAITPGVVVANPPAPTVPVPAIPTPAILPGPLPIASAPASAMSPATTSSEVTPATATMPAASSAAITTVPVATMAASAPVLVATATSTPAEPSFIDRLLNNRFMLARGIGLLAFLAAYSAYRTRQRKNAVAIDSSFLESRLQPDSFFGASGGQRVDTSESSVSGSSMVYSPSQLDAAGDVDPVAEADVYLAYGRDLQAEEILKEAIRVSPTRVAIFAKRREAKAFEMVASEAYELTRGTGAEWAHMAEMGRDLDPSNPMYQPGGLPTSVGVAAADTDTTGFATQTMPQTYVPAPEPAAAAVDFDLDLDFSLDDEPAAPAQAATSHIEPTVAMPAVAATPADNGLDFSAATVAMPAVAAAPAPAASSSLSFTSAPVVTTEASPQGTAGGMLEFDLGALSLDLDSQTTESQRITTAAATLSPEIADPLETKFALAEEFRSIGDTEGARSLAEEVLEQSNGALKGKAQAFLNALS